MRRSRILFCLLLILCLLMSVTFAEDTVEPARTAEPAETAAPAETAVPSEADEPEREWRSVGAIVGKYYYDLDMGITILMKGKDSGTFTLIYPDTRAEGTWHTVGEGKFIFDINGSPVDVFLTPQTGYLVLSIDGNSMIAFLPPERIAAE